MKAQQAGADVTTQRRAHRLDRSPGSLAIATLMSPGMLQSFRYLAILECDVSWQ